MTMIDMDDSLFACRNVEEMGAIEEEQFQDEQEHLQKKTPFDQSNSSNKSRGSNNSSRFQYPTTLDEAGGVASRNDDVMRPLKKPKKKVEKNRDFKDVEETGKWGAVSRKEVVCVGTILALVVVGVLVGLFFVLTGGGDEDEQIVLEPPPPVEVEKSYLTKQEHYNDLVLKINEYPAVADAILLSFPGNVDDLADETVYVEAAQWLVVSDAIPVKWERNIIPRFVLAVTYIANGGDNWKNNENWLWEQEVCDWFGVSCDKEGRIMEVDLTDNGLTGSMHEAWNLLSHCISIMLGNNALTGPIPGTALGNMPKLEYLNLESNQLTGTIPLSLKDLDTLDTLMLQNTNLTGSWPDMFCPTGTNNPPFREFTLDCDEVECSCCNSYNNCFVHE